jgi:hypothetical protein
VVESKPAEDLAISERTHPIVAARFPVLHALAKLLLVEVLSAGGGGDVRGVDHYEKTLHPASPLQLTL